MNNPETTAPFSTEAMHSTAYNLFILVLTVISLVVMVAIVLPLDDSTIHLLQFYDNFICVIFLFDFALNLKNAPSKRWYFIGQRGWLDLLGSIPSVGLAFKYSGLFRLARLSRLARISRLLRGKARKELVTDLLTNRGKYAAFVTILSALIVMATTSVLVLQFESNSSESKILNGWDAFWYSMVTITTVGYGDYYPVTFGGRVTAMFIMVAGIGIIGALASILASVLVGGGEEPETAAAAPDPEGLDSELRALRAEVAEMKVMLERLAPPGHAGT